MKNNINFHLFHIITHYHIFLQAFVYFFLDK